MSTPPPAASPASGALDRDRLTWYVYALLGVYGFFLYGFNPSISLLREDQDVSRAVSSLHGTALAAGAILAGLLGPWLVQRFGRGVMLRAGVVGIVLGVLAYIATPVLGLTLLAALCCGTAGSIVLNTHSPVLTAHHGPVAGAGAVSEANAVGAAVGIAAPLLVGGAQAVGLGWRVGLALVLVPAAVALWAFRGTEVPEPAGAAQRPGAHPVDAHPAGVHGASDQHPEQTAAGPRQARLPAAYWWAWTTLVALIAVEFCMTIWAPDLLRSRVGLGEGTAAAGVTAIVAGMAFGRLVGGRLALRHSTDRLLLGSLVTTAAGWLVFWVSTHPVPALVGLVVVGLGVATQFPLAITRAIVASGGHPDRATARASLGAGVAIGGGPFVLGGLADAFGTHRAFLVVPALLALAGVLLLSTRASGRAAADPA